MIIHTANLIQVKASSCSIRYKLMSILRQGISGTRGTLNARCAVCTGCLAMTITIQSIIIPRTVKTMQVRVFSAIRSVPMLFRMKTKITTTIAVINTNILDFR